MGVTLRSGRRLTLPPEVCEALGLQVGDRLELALTQDGVVVRPKKRLALKALAEIQAAFADSDLTEDELQAE